MQVKLKSTQIFFFSLLLAFTVVTASCNNARQTTIPSGTTKPAPPNKQIFRWGIAGNSDFQTLDPALVQGGPDISVISTIFTGLVKLDQQGNVKDQLAASHQVSTDGLTYTFHLKPQLKFSDRKPLTASDVAYSINRTLSPSTQSPVASYLGLIKDADKLQAGKIKTLIGDSLIVPNPSTISIVLRQPAAYFLQTLAYPTSYVVERRLIEKYGKQWTDHLEEGGGAGPFKVMSYSHSFGIKLVPNPLYYGAQTRLKRLEVHISGDVDAAYKAYLSGQYDYTGVPFGLIPEVSQRSDYRNVKELALRTIQMNYLAKPFDNEKIRQAFALALDRNLIARTLFRGEVIPTNRLMPQGMYGASPTEIPGPDGNVSISGNQELAKQLFQEGLQEEGYSSLSQLPPLSFSELNDSNSLKRANALIDQWKVVLGVNININAVDANSYDQQVSDNAGKANWQMWDYAWQADYPDPHDWLNVFFGNGADYNNMNYGENYSDMASSQRAIQAQLDSADTVRDPGVRADIYHRIEQHLASEAAWITLYQTSIGVVVSPHVHGYQDSRFGVFDPDSWGNVYILASK